MMAAAPIAWYGGKARLASRIVDLLPRHATYVEAFSGAASVLFAKARVTLEVYNDIDSGLVTFFRVLRDQPTELARRLRLTPYSREEFIGCRDAWQNTHDDVERARRWYVPSVWLLSVAQLGLRTRRVAQRRNPRGKEVRYVTTRARLQQRHAPGPSAAACHGS